ncbi:1,3-beta-glucan synthase subunit FKS1, domain-1-domain-containing protein [Jimgerdemannia flammicorona]|uniref:1,3-beta-glucan synthase subunit FKS1, domain-1-domain-containing protein n=1 Tax=Jimgerdemannia flammicorona TaxID=994334 RepID=A0A433DMI8_9FUNG|nr:1,3-beta-glucan synthase subunit FKS1, domain-1-domain-containing protein [Jimgerdemannia flammicorona]
MSIETGAGQQVSTEAEYDENSGASTPHTRDPTLGQNGGIRHPDLWPSWGADQQLPLSRESLDDIFVELSNRFGFQRDSTRNMFEHMMTMLDSRASRMTPTLALVTLHADYIGGEHANYRKWYFAAQLDLDEAVGDRNVASGGVGGGVASADELSRSPRAEDVSTESESTDNLEKAEARWQRRMHTMSEYEKARQVALYLLIWGESAVVRFTPECLCFIFKLANDYYVSGEWQTCEHAPEGTFLADVVTPIYRFLRDEQYEIIGDKFVKRERDHAQIIGYDDVNQLFWYPETIDRIVLKDKKTKLHDLPAQRRYLALKDVAWELTFQKTYKERRTWLHLAVNFTRIWIIHVVVFYYYTSYNAPFLYLNADPDIAATETAVQWRCARVSLHARGRRNGVLLRPAHMEEHERVDATHGALGLDLRNQLCALDLRGNRGPDLDNLMHHRDPSILRRDRNNAHLHVRADLAALRLFVANEPQDAGVADVHGVVP